MKKEKNRSNWITIAIIIVCVVAFLLQTYDETLLEKFGNIPALINMGEYYRLITYGFLHGNISHIASNMIILLLIGNEVEHKGKLKFVIIYILSIIGGGIGSYASFMALSKFHSLSIGASGAIFGLLGYSLNIYLANEGSEGYDDFGRWLINLLMINFVATFMVPKIDIGAHIGGFLTGFIISIFFDKKDK